MFGSYLCGGDCIEDVMDIKPFWDDRDDIRICSSDVILRTLRKLSSDDMSYESDQKKFYAFNVNEKMNSLLLKCLAAARAARRKKDNAGKSLTQMRSRNGGSVVHSHRKVRHAVSRRQVRPDLLFLDAGRSDRGMKEDMTVYGSFERYLDSLRSLDMTIGNSFDFISSRCKSRTSILSFDE